MGLVLYCIQSTFHSFDYTEKKKKKNGKREELRFESSPGYNIIIFPWPRLREKWLKSFSRNVFD